MRLRWTATAFADPEGICDYIAETSPNSARRVADTILEGLTTLGDFPNSGRTGRVEGPRELIFAPLPFVAIYEVADHVTVLRILHGAQRWP